VRRRVPIVLLVGALVSGCGGGEAAGDATTTIEFEPPTTTPTTASPPPPTLAPNSTRPPGQTVTTVPPTTAPPAATLAPASSADIAALVGDAEWDPNLPLPDACMDDATFAPTIPGGSTGGTVRCSFGGYGIADVAAFVRTTSASRRLRFDESGGGSPTVTFTYGNIGSIRIEDEGGGRIALTASQDYSS
jgi:hypothetical protein